MRSVYVSTGVWVLGMSMATAASAGPQYAPYGNNGGYPQVQTIRCESTDGRERQCAIDTRGGVGLSKQLSRTACIEGRNWGYDRSGVWVSDGCRAEFRTGGGWSNNNGNNYGNGGGQIVRCESSNGRYRQCSADARGGVRLTRQLSGTSCIEGQTWGANRAGIWVDRGCRAEFETGFRGNNGWGWGQGQQQQGPGYGPGYDQNYGTSTVRCESNDGRTNRCGAPIRGGARLQRQISNTQCQQGRNWGWDPGGIWVSGGCRADFAVW